MILKNPENGATIETTMRGKKWFFPKNTVQKFDDEIGRELKAIYGFLEEVATVEKANAVVIPEGFKCSICEFQSKTKIAVLGHIRSHPEGVETIEAKPVGEASKRPTLYEARNARLQGDDSDLNRQYPQVEFYGEGFEETSMATGTQFTGKI